MVRSYTAGTRCVFARLQYWKYLGVGISLLAVFFVFSANAIAQAEEPIEASGEEARPSEVAPEPGFVEPASEQSLEPQPSSAPVEASEPYQEPAEPVVSEGALEEPSAPASVPNETAPEETVAAEPEPVVTGGFLSPEPEVESANKAPVDEPHPSQGAIDEEVVAEEVVAEEVVAEEVVAEEVVAEEVVAEEVVAAPVFSTPAIPEPETTESSASTEVASEAFVPEPDVDGFIVPEPVAPEEPVASEYPAETVAVQPTVPETQSLAPEPIPPGDLPSVQEAVHQDAARPVYTVEHHNETTPNVAATGPKPENTAEPTPSAAHAPAIQTPPDKQAVEPASQPTVVPPAGPDTGRVGKESSSLPPPRADKQPAAYKSRSADKTLLDPWLEQSTVSTVLFAELFQVADDEPGRVGFSALEGVGDSANPVSTSEVPPATPVPPTPVAPFSAGGFLPATGSSSGGGGFNPEGSENLLDTLGILSVLSIFLVRGKIRVVPVGRAFVPGSLPLPVSERPG